MKTQIRLWLLLAGLAIPALAQTAAPNPAQPAPSWTEHYRKSTISFGRIVTDGDRSVYQAIGTGVIVAIDQSKVFIVTAKHVFDDPAQSWHPSELRVRFAWQENKSIAEEHGIPIKLTDVNGSNLWKSLPDGGDLASLPLPESFRGLPLHAIGLNDFATADDLWDGATVFVYGFPADVGRERLVRAITRSGVVAWTDPNDPTGLPFLIDANILPGNSGGPVFKVPIGMGKNGNFVLGGRVAFLGIVTQDLSGFYSVQADGRIIQIQFPDLRTPSVEQVQVTGIGGLGTVEPAQRVRRLIESMSHPSTR